MTGDKGTDPREFEEAPKDLDWFLANYTPNCPTCDTTKWTFSKSGESSDILSLPVLDREKMQVGAYGPVIALVCENCGYMRLHARAQFFSYVEALKIEMADQN